MNKYNDQFDTFAAYYDKLNYSIKFKKIADYTEKVFEFYKVKPELVLDLACGTGSLSIELSKRGYDMTGVDISTAMLDIASKKSHAKNKNILWLCQDMLSFELYGTVDAVLCYFDSLNYLNDTNDLEKVFKLVYQYLNPEGVYIFDVKSRYKYEKILNNSTFVLEKKDIYCIWQNMYDNRTGVCDFDLTLFIKTENNKYIKKVQKQIQKFHETDDIINMLKKTGFSHINICSEFKIDKQKKYPERLCFYCKK